MQLGNDLGTSEPKIVRADVGQRPIATARPYRNAFICVRQIYGRFPGTHDGRAMPSA